MDFITSLLTEWGYLALFIIMALENMNIPIPSEIWDLPDFWYLKACLPSGLLSLSAQLPD